MAFGGGSGRRSMEAPSSHHVLLASERRLVLQDARRILLYILAGIYTEAVVLCCEVCAYIGLASVGASLAIGLVTACKGPHS